MCEVLTSTCNLTRKYLNRPNFTKFPFFRNKTFLLNSRIAFLGTIRVLHIYKTHVCTKTVKKQHLNTKTRIPPIRNYLDMTGNQFQVKKKYAKPSLPTAIIANEMLNSKHEKSTSLVHYSHIISTIPPANQRCDSSTNITKHIHTTLTHIYLMNREPNYILNKHSPEIYTSKDKLKRKARIYQTQLRSPYAHKKNKLIKYPLTLSLLQSQRTQNMIFQVAQPYSLMNVHRTTP